MPENQKNKDDPLLAQKLEDLYGTYRSTYMTYKYYARRLSAVRDKNFYLDVFLAITTSSTVGGWLIWQFDLGATFWAIVSGIAMALGIVKPTLQYPATIERYAKVWLGLGEVYERLDRIVKEVQRTRSFPPRVEKALEVAREKAARLREFGDPVLIPSELEACYNEVEREIPAIALWSPSNPIAKGDA
jgi:hypothetical protein